MEVYILTLYGGVCGIFSSKEKAKEQGIKIALEEPMAGDMEKPEKLESHFGIDTWVLDDSSEEEKRSEEFLVEWEEGKEKDYKLT